MILKKKGKQNFKITRKIEINITATNQIVEKYNQKKIEKMEKMIQKCTKISQCKIIKYIYQYMLKMNEL